MSGEITKKVLENHLRGHLRIYEYIDMESNSPINRFWKEELETELKMLNPIEIDVDDAQEIGYRKGLIEGKRTQKQNDHLKFIKDLETLPIWDSKDNTFTVNYTEINKLIERLKF